MLHAGQQLAEKRFGPICGGQRFPVAAIEIGDLQLAVFARGAQVNLPPIADFIDRVEAVAECLGGEGVQFFAELFEAGGG